MTQEELKKANELVRQIEHCQEIIDKYAEAKQELVIGLENTDPIAILPTFGGRVIEILKDYKKTLELKFEQL